MTTKVTGEMIYAEQMTQRETLARIEARLDKLQDQAERAPRAHHTTAQHASGGATDAIQPATDEDLAGPHGDDPVRRDPKRWTGRSYVGEPLSRCPVDYLTALADLYRWQYEQDLAKGDERAKWKKLDCQRALGWRRRAEAEGRLTADPDPHAHGLDMARADGVEPTDDEDLIPFLPNVHSAPGPLCLTAGRALGR